ncbi:MAG TPA: septation protein SepH [Frankiaceae bacterium]|nr:septation protein SepH [Frankiaceae bacterium]
MRELHVVALSSDGKHLVVSPNKGSLKGAFLLPVNARLHKALAGELNAPRPPRKQAAGEPAGDAATAAALDGPGADAPDGGRRGGGAKQAGKPPAESRLSPREIQARLRAGQAPERVARAAGVPVDRVTRFYGPVLSERAQVIDAARDGMLTRARLGASKAPLGAAVAANLVAKGLTATEDDWAAYRRPDGTWVVALTVTGRGKPRTAEWTWHPATKTVAALDTFAATLGHVEKPIPKPRSAKAAAKAARPARPAPPAR